MTSDETERPVAKGSKAVIIGWCATFVVTMVVVGVSVTQLGLSPIWKMVAMIMPMVLLIPMVRSTERLQQGCGNYSPALRHYNRRSLIWSFAYVIALTFAISVYRGLQPHGIWLWLIAILPSLPLFFFIYTMGRYLVEEKDEYLRQRAILSGLWATGILLAVATCYGFLETFKLVPHVPGWAAVPVWAIGLAIGGLVVRRSS